MSNMLTVHQIRKGISTKDNEPNALLQTKEDMAANGVITPSEVAILRDMALVARIEKRMKAGDTAVFDNKFVLRR